MNTTYNAAANNYEITPARHELPQEVLNDPDNYDIANLRSDEDTDDEDNPRKKPAAWTQGMTYRQKMVCDIRAVFEVLRLNYNDGLPHFH